MSLFKTRNYGKFSVPGNKLEFILEHTTAFHDIAILEAKLDWISNRFEYTAYGKYFEEVPINCIAPEYRLLIIPSFEKLSKVKFEKI